LSAVVLYIGADSNLRDYSGKKAYQYLKRADCTFSISSDTFRSEFTSSSYSSSSSASTASKAAGGGGFDRGSGLYSSLRNMKFHMKIPSTSSSNNKSSSSGGGEVVTSSADSVFGSGGVGSGSSDVGDGSGSTYSSSSSSVSAAGLGEPLSKRRPPSVHSATGGGASGSSSTAFLRDVRSGSARRRANSASAFVNHTT